MPYWSGIKARMSDSFTKIARHYDELMVKIPYEMWVDYLRLLWAKHDVQPKTVLDVCCGTGSAARFLARRGYVLSGVDKSAQMIEVAIEREQKKGGEIDFHVQDISELNLGRQFDAAYSFFDSFNYITDPAQLALAIKAIYEHLVDGGVLVFDVNTEIAFAEKLFDQRNLKKSAPLRYKWVGSYDKETRLIEVDMQFWTEDGPFKEVHVQRAHKHEELIEMMRNAGFAEISAYDSYTLNPPRRDSDRLHYVGIKRGEVK